MYPPSQREHPGILFLSLPHSVELIFQSTDLLPRDLETLSGLLTRWQILELLRSSGAETIMELLSMLKVNIESCAILSRVQRYIAYPDLLS